MNEPVSPEAIPESAENLSEVARLRMPAEWEPHEAVWIGWPHNTSDWPGKFAPIHWVYAEIAYKITPGEILRILVNSPRHESRAKAVLKSAGADLARTEFFHIPTNRGWTRDFGPIFAHRSRAHSSDRVVLRFQFNAWAKYADWQLDNEVPERVATALGIPLVAAGEFVLEGGAIDVNGEGSLVTTEECLLDPAAQARNPGLSRSGAEEKLRDYLGASQVLWLGRGIAGDDTHGHVDDVCRFVNPRTVVLCQESDPRDANYQLLSENRERLESVRLANGSKLEVIALPMPSPLHFRGQRLPASYANFYIANAAVLVPTFNDPHDRAALGILGELFSDRPVIGIHATDLVWGLGTLHCMTQQQPAPRETLRSCG
ncbi:MAG: agmatine deiminase family protein [Candidatus Acidiferrales bacterium]